MYKAIRKRTFEILEPGSQGDLTSKIVDLLIMSLILLNVAAVILETVHGVQARFGAFLHIFDLFSVGVFTVEYVLRVWSCTSDERFTHPVKGRLRFMVRPMAVIDLLAILPFFLPRLFPMDMREVRVLRLFRLLRIFKLGRYSTALQLLGRVLFNKKEELAVGLMVMLILLVFASSSMYYVEREAQPEAFSSIPAAMWWSIVTLTTVGYGDVSPVTPLGKVLAAFVALIGVGTFALPTAILANGFTQEINRRHKDCGQPRCPHCGGPIGRRKSDYKTYQYTAKAS